MNVFDDLKLQFRIGDVTTKLIYWNVALFVVPMLFFGLLQLFKIRIDYLDFVSLSTVPRALLWKPWSVISYAFFHNGIFHILFNMLMLNFSGKLFTTFFTQKQLLNLYIVSAIFGGIVYIISYMIFPALANSTVSMVGASGAVMAILVATASYQPTMEIRLLLIGNVKLVYFVLFLLILDLIQLPMNNTGGHLAHLGGAFFGYFYVKQIQNGTDITKWLGWCISYCTTFGMTKKTTPFKSVHVNPRKPVQKSESKIITKDQTQQKIDLILDKISKSGYDSLDPQEKEFLFKMGSN